MKKILICDDEALVLSGLASAVKALSASPVEVHTASSGSGALQEAKSLSFDICFLDIRLPDINGLEVMLRIRETSPGTEIVMISACELTSEMARLMHQCAARFIPKPFEMGQIQEALRAAA